MGIAANRGRAAESLAASFLELTGVRVLARNVRLGGVEVDAVAVEGNTRVLVEVKVRSRVDFGGAAMSVDASKRRRLLRAAAALLAQGGGPVRVDVVAIDLESEGATVRHHRAAIEAS